MNQLARCHPPRRAGWRASDELFSANCEPTADASHYGRGRTLIFLCSAAGFGGFKFRGLRPALVHTL